MKKYFWLAIILIIGTLLRVYHNTDISLWHDEAFSALMIKYPWQEMFYRLGLDVHPPMYYIFLRWWSYLFGEKMPSLRGFSVLFGVLTVWAVWLFTKEVFRSDKIAIWAALLSALNPFQVQYVTEARMYTMGAFFAVMAAYFLVRALREQKQYYDDMKLHMPNLPKDIKIKSDFEWSYFGFALCTAIIILTHYYLLFTAAALMLYGLFYCIAHYKKEFKKYILFLVACAVSLICFLPWFKTFLSQVKSVGQSYWIPPMDIWSIPGTFWSILLGIDHNNQNHLTQIMMIVVVLFSIYFFWRFLRKNSMPEKWLILSLTIAPFFGAVLFEVYARLKGSQTSVYEERYFLFCSMFYVIALAVWLSQIKIKWLSVSLFTLYALFNVYAFVNYWHGLDIAAHPGMNGAAKFLGANVQSGDHLFVGTSFEYFNYEYYNQTYYHTPVPPLLYTNGRSSISQISSVEGVALLSNSNLAPSFTQGVHTGDTVWLLWTNGFGSSKPALPSNWQQVDEQQYPDVRPYLGTTIYVDEFRVNGT